MSMVQCSDLELNTQKNLSLFFHQKIFIEMLVVVKILYISSVYQNKLNILGFRLKSIQIYYTFILEIVSVLSAEALLWRTSKEGTMREALNVCRGPDPGEIFRVTADSLVELQSDTENLAWFSALQNLRWTTFNITCEDNIIY